MNNQLIVDYEAALADLAAQLAAAQERIRQLEKIISDWMPLMYVHFPDMFTVVETPPA